MAFIPHTPADVEAMLATIGVASIEQLFDEIPASLRVKSLDGVPVGLNEMQIGRLMSERARADGRSRMLRCTTGHRRSRKAASWPCARIANQSRYGSSCHEA
jgi:glycine dehydrogenase subunit 1